MEMKKLFDRRNFSGKQIDDISSLKDKLYHDYDYHCGHFFGLEYSSIVDSVSAIVSHEYGRDLSFVKSALSEWRIQTESPISNSTPVQAQFDEISDLIDQWKKKVNYQFPVFDYSELDRTMKQRDIVYRHIIERLSTRLSGFNLVKNHGEFLVIADLLISGHRMAQVDICVRTRYGYDIVGRIRLPSKMEDEPNYTVNINDLVGRRLCAALNLGLLPSVKFRAVKDNKIHTDLDKFIDIILIFLKYVDDILA